MQAWWAEETYLKTLLTGSVRVMIVSLTCFGRFGLTPVSLYPMAAYSLVFSAGDISSSKPERYEPEGQRIYHKQIYIILLNI